MYYTYMLRCGDNSIYSGIASDLEGRMKIHFGGGENGAKYVISRGAVRLEAYWISDNRSEASKLEYKLKQLTRIQKEELISGNCELKDFFYGKIEIESYIKGNMDEKNLSRFVRGRK